MENLKYQRKETGSLSSETSNEEAAVVKHFEEGFRLLAMRIARVIIQEFQGQANGAPIQTDHLFS